MKNVLLISNKVLHYRIKIYNFLKLKLNQKGYTLILLANKIQDNIDQKLEFENYIEPFNFFKYLKRINQINPSYVIIFLHFKNLLMFPIILYLKYKKIPIIYWNHGINLQDPNNIFKNWLYYRIHSLVDRILLYSPNEIKFIKPKNHKKIFIANNTIVFDEKLYPIKEKKGSLKNKLNIKSNFNILFVGRDRVYKKLNVIIELVQSLNCENIGLIIVGPTDDKQKIIQKINGYDQIKYLGEIYNKQELSKIYWISDIFCIPGTNGLGLNEAMFWGLPCLALNERHSPEIWYLTHGESGFVLNNIQELKETILKLFNNRKLMRDMSIKSRETILSKGHINNMYDGFENVLESFKK